MYAPASSSQMRRWASQYGSYTPSTDVPNLVNWWRADTVTTVSGAVSSLNDKKGSVNLAQGAAGKRPTYNAADSLMGGRDSMTFDGIDDALTVASPGIGALNAITMYLVVRSVVTPAVTARLLAIGNVSVAQSIASTVTTGGNLDVSYSNPGNSTNSWRLTPGQSDFATAAPRVLSHSIACQNAAASTFVAAARLGLLGTLQTAAATSSTIATQAVCLGAATGGTSNYAAFTFAELMICSAAHTSEQMLAVNMYLAGYYGVLS